MENGKWNSGFDPHQFSIFHFPFAIFYFSFSISQVSRVGCLKLILDKLYIPAQAGSRLRLCSLQGLSNAIGSRARDGSGNG